MQDAANIRPLTSLRFFAALWVVLFHYWPKLDVAFTPALVAKGYLGVELFFVLSGFILCHVYLAAAGEGRLKYGAFLWNRLARVYPLHLATLFGMIALGVVAGLAGVAIDGEILRWDALPANLLMVQAWGLAPAAAFNHPSWSISAEWFAYLTFPAFAFVAWRLRARPWLFAGGTLAAMAILYPTFQALTGQSLTPGDDRLGRAANRPLLRPGLRHARPVALRRGEKRSHGGHRRLYFRRFHPRGRGLGPARHAGRGRLRRPDPEPRGPRPERI